MKLPIICIAALLCATPVLAQERLDHGFFHDIVLTRPAADASHTVLLLDDAADAAGCCSRCPRDSQSPKPASWRRCWSRCWPRADSSSAARRCWRCLLPAAGCWRWA